MKLGLLADLHGNLSGLKDGLAVLAGADRVLFAGDALNSYRMQPEIIELLDARGVEWIVGNNERSLLRHTPEADRRIGDKDAWDRLVAAPARLQLEIDGLRVLMVHGSPWEPQDEYLYPQHPRLADVGSLGVDVLIYGHTHVPLEQRVGDTLVINPGSAGDARGWNGGRLSCALLDTATGDVRFDAFDDRQLRKPVRASAAT